MKEWQLDQIVMAGDTVSYMASIEKMTGNSISLEQAYNDKGVPMELRLSEEEIEKIISQYLSK